MSDQPHGQPFLGGNRRAQGVGLSRFVGTGAHADRQQAALAPDHPAMREMRTLFPSMVFDPETVPRLLVSGHNSAKTGKQVRKGPWRGFPIFTLTLEERATCPSTCKLLAECYGNAIPFTRRPKHGPALIERLEAELHEKAREHPRGFAVRVHVLGDFWSLDYVRAWGAWMEAIPALHAWGYTAHAPGSAIGAAIAAGNGLWPKRWLFRFSGSDDPRVPQAHTIWRKPEGAWVPEGLVCPAQTKKTLACATCGLCWSPAAADTPIVFIGHGMATRRDPGASPEKARRLPRPGRQRAAKRGPAQDRSGPPAAVRLTLPRLASLEDLAWEQDHPRRHERGIACQWPLGGTAAQKLRMCGDPVKKGTPYCAAHCRNAYRPAPHAGPPARAGSERGQAMTPGPRRNVV